MTDQPPASTAADSDTTVAQLRSWVLEFSRERDWEQFHLPKDLGVALVCEVGELLEHFRYRSDEQIRESLDHPHQRLQVAHELADCLWLILRLADVCGIDLSRALAEKLAEAAAKYPVELARGKPHKYTAYLGKKPDSPAQGDCLGAPPP